MALKALTASSVMPTFRLPSHLREQPRFHAGDDRLKVDAEVLGRLLQAQGDARFLEADTLDVSTCV